MSTAPAEILASLVAIPSVSSQSNQPLLDSITELLIANGWKTELQTYTASDGIAKSNLIAYPAKFQAQLPNINLLFVCHTDTVPYRTQWKEATTLTEADGMLHGCGSCDVKGALAGLLAAATEIDAQTIPLPVAFAFTAEEEIGCIGATKLVSSGAIRARHVVVCEPTSLRPATAGKGYGLAEVRVTGHEAHSAFPAKGVSAINAAAQVIVRLEQWQRETPRTPNPLFDPPYTTFNVGVLHGGSAKNIIAGECTFLVEWRPVPTEDPTLGGTTIQELVQEIAEQNPRCTMETRILRADPGFSNPANATLGPALSAMLRRAETGICFGSEATRFAAIAEEAVVIGPGDMETAHSERERIPLTELEEWTQTVKHLLQHGLPANNPAKPDAS